VRALTVPVAFALVPSRAPATEAEAFDRASIPVRVTFSSSATECSDPSEFLRLLRGHRPEARASIDSERAIRIDVQLQVQADHYEGKMELISWDDLTSQPQKVQAADCHDILIALAFKATMDPGLLPLPTPTPSLSSSSSASAEGRAIAGTSPPGPVSTVDVGQSVAALSAGPGLTWGLGLQAMVARGGSLWAPAIRVEAYLAESGVLSRGSDYAKFELLDARLALCPSLLTIRASLELRPCGFLDAGRLSVTGKNLPITSIARTPWSALGAELVLNWVASSALSVGAQAGVMFPLTRNDFYFRRSGQVPIVYTTHWADVMVAAGVGWRFDP
jgi:hypothetical protein